MPLPRLKGIVYPAGCKEISEDMSNDDLIRRLKDIAMQFQCMSQDDENNQYTGLAVYLSSEGFLNHPSRDVRLLVACSIADVFRVFAPNAPYQEPDLIRKIFMFFIRQLKGLQDPKDPTFKRYFYLLENLAWVKSFNICIELQDSSYIFCRLFGLMFRIVNDNHSDKVKNFMLDMMCPLIMESDTVPSKLIEIILWQLIEPKKSQNKCAFDMAAKLVEKTGKTCEPYIVNYFTHAINNGIQGKPGQLSDDEEDILNTPKYIARQQRQSKASSNPSPSTTVVQLCELIFELYAISPNIVQQLLPHIEHKVRSNDEKERCEFTKLLARLFSLPKCKLAQHHPELWKSFLGRFRDISVQVRTRCVQYSMHFLLHHPDLRADITEQLKMRQHDSEEAVRYEVVMAIVAAAKKGLAHVNEELIIFVKDRTADKKLKIRKEALSGLAALYRMNLVHTMTEAQSDRPIYRILRWIKNKCLHNYAQAALEDKLLVEKLLLTCLIPMGMELPKRMKVLYAFYCNIDPFAAKALNDLLKNQLTVRRQVKEMIDVVKEEKSEDRALNLKSKILATAKFLPEAVKAEEYLTKLCHNLESNTSLLDSMQVIVTCSTYVHMNEDGTICEPANVKMVEEAVKDVLKSLGFPVQTNSFYVIIKQLMERIAPILLDHQGLLMLFQFVENSLLGDGSEDTLMGFSVPSAKRGLQLILSLSAVFPAMFYGSQIFHSYLLPFLWGSLDGEPEIAELVLQILTRVGGNATRLEPMDPSLLNTGLPWWMGDESVVDRIVEHFILKARSVKQTKYAIQCLNAMLEDESTKKRIFSSILDKVKGEGMSLDTVHFRNHLVAVGMIAQHGGHVFFPKQLKSIIKIQVVQNLMMKDQRLDMEVARAEEEDEGRAPVSMATWKDSLQLCSEEVKCKVEGIKLMVRWLAGIKTFSLSTEPGGFQAYETHANNTLQILKTIIENDGDLNGNGLVGTTREKAHLRLAAGLGALKICVNDSFQGCDLQGEFVYSCTSATSTILSGPQWHAIAALVFDAVDWVREKFSSKLNKGLTNMTLGMEFLSYFSLSGILEEGPHKNRMRIYLNNNMCKRRDLVKSRQVTNLKAVIPDCVIPYVIHLVSHQSFYTRFNDEQQLAKVSECIWFMLDNLILRNDNFSFTYYKRTFENIKTCVDLLSLPPEGVSPLEDEEAKAINFRLYSATDLALMLVMSKTTNFLLKDFPVNASLPAKYYVVSSYASENNSKVYLPTTMQVSPPKRCGLEAEMLQKISKNVDKSSPKVKGHRSIAATTNNNNQVSIASTSNQEFIVYDTSGEVVYNSEDHKEQMQTVLLSDGTEAHMSTLQDAIVLSSLGGGDPSVGVNVDTVLIMDPNHSNSNNITLGQDEHHHHLLVGQQEEVATLSEVEAAAASIETSEESAGGGDTLKGVTKRTRSRGAAPATPKVTEEEPARKSARISKK